MKEWIDRILEIELYVAIEKKNISSFYGTIILINNLLPIFSTIFIIDNKRTLIPSVLLFHPRVTLLPACMLNVCVCCAHCFPAVPRLPLNSWSDVLYPYKATSVTSCFSQEHVLLRFWDNKWTVRYALLGVVRLGRCMTSGKCHLYHWPSSFLLKWLAWGGYGKRYSQRSWHTENDTCV